jgi:hypothetical protein
MSKGYCVICGKPINSDLREVTCSRECFRRYQSLYNHIYGSLYRRFQDKK